MTKTTTRKNFETRNAVTRGRSEHFVAVVTDLQFVIPVCCSST